jgi:hypothetical protein
LPDQHLYLRTMMNSMIIQLEGNINQPGSPSASIITREFNFFI